MLSSSAPDVYTQPCILPLITLDLAVRDPVCFVWWYNHTLSVPLHDSIRDRARMVQNLEKLEFYTLVPCSIPFPLSSYVELFFTSSLKNCLHTNEP